MSTNVILGNMLLAGQNVAGVANANVAQTCAITFTALLLLLLFLWLIMHFVFILTFSAANKATTSVSFSISLPLPVSLDSRPLPCVSSRGDKKRVRL